MRNMKYRRKQFYSLILSLTLVFSLSATAGATHPANISGTINNVTTIIAGSEDNQHIMTGQNGATLLVESISSDEYKELVNILYPNGIVDHQGQEIGGIDNMESVRAQFIDKHMQAYSISGSKQVLIRLDPFSVMLECETNGEFEALFFKACIGKDVFVFPSEWGHQPFGFIHNSEENVYLASTDRGIWRISPSDETATKITTDLYMGQTQDDVAKKRSESIPGACLLWIDSVTISPSGQFVVYRTNRDADDGVKTSLWKIDLNSGCESRLVASAENNDIVGFISNNMLVTGALTDTCLVNVIDGKRTSVDIPDMPNKCVRGVNNGIIVIMSYDDGSSVTTAYINDVNTETGKIVERSSVQGYLAGEPIFSPSGSKIAIGYGEDAEIGTNDVVVVDTVAYTKTRLAETLRTHRGNESFSSNIVRCLWIDDDIVLLNTKEENNMSAITSPDLSARATTASYNITFGDVPPSVVNFNSPLSTTLSNLGRVNSKWNQPRSVGTNPHNGVDLNAGVGTSVYAPYSGWVKGITAAGTKDIELLVDANENGLKDDGDYCVRFYHMSDRIANGYVNKGEYIGKSGKEGTKSAHLHFGICSVNDGVKWLRNELNYRYLSTSNWASGRDLDLYSQVHWNHNYPSLMAYVIDDGDTEPLAEVRMFYRTTPTGLWTDGGLMTQYGDAYVYDFNNIFPLGTTVYWMVRLTRTGVSQAAFCPAKYAQPANDPNNASEPYGYWVNTMAYYDYSDQ